MLIIINALDRSEALAVISLDCTCVILAGFPYRGICIVSFRSCYPDFTDTSSEATPGLLMVASRHTLTGSMRSCR